MCDKKFLLKTIIAVGLIFSMVVSMSACVGGSEKWKEEVQLSDGRVVVVERETIRVRGGDEWAHNRSGTKPKEHRIRFADGAASVIEWKTTKLSPSTWPEIPLIFDLEAGQPMVVASVYVSAGCEIYTKHVYRNGAWIEEKLPDKFERRITNLLIRDGNDMPEFVSLKEKQRENSNLGYRLALRQVGPARRICG